MVNSQIFKNTCCFIIQYFSPLYSFTWERKDPKMHFETNCELSQDHTEKQIMSSKATVNWLFNDISCYLVIGCFDLKIGVFQ